MLPSMSEVYNKIAMYPSQKHLNLNPTKLQIYTSKKNKIPRIKST